MTILKKSKIGSKLMTIIVVVAVLAVGVPLVSAYEAHTVNVKAHVKDRFNVVKTIRLADAQDIDDAIEAGISFPNPPHGSDNISDPYNVPINTCVVWIVTIGFQNSENYTMTNVVVRDHFGAELAGEPTTEVNVDVDFKTHSRGKGKKEKDPFTSQYRIYWYVTYVSGDLENPETVDNSGEMLPGASEYIELYVWTDLNPSGKQSYTSPGDYTLNSGPTAKWLVYPDGPQYSFGGDALAVHIEAE